MAGDISGGGVIARIFSRATSTPSSMVNSSGIASNSILRTGSIWDRVVEVSVMDLTLARHPTRGAYWSVSCRKSS